jgi:hypothetical protein
MKSTPFQIEDVMYYGFGPSSGPAHAYWYVIMCNNDSDTKFVLSFTDMGYSQKQWKMHNGGELRTNFRTDSARERVSGNRKWAVKLQLCYDRLVPPKIND